MSRSLPFGLSTTQRAGALAPVVSVEYAARYLGRPVLGNGGSVDDGLATTYVSLGVRGSELLLCKIQGTGARVQRRNLGTLAVTSAWFTWLSGIPAGMSCGLTQSGSDILVAAPRTTAIVRYRRSTDGGATWIAGVDMHTCGVGNTVGHILTSRNGMIAIEERRPGLTALIYTYIWNGAGWTLYDTHDTGGTQIHGGGIETEGSTWMFYAVDVPEATMAGTVTMRYARVYDLDSLVVRGTLHRGSLAGREAAVPERSALRDGHGADPKGQW
jgi:hypothetical protein